LTPLTGSPVTVDVYSGKLNGNVVDWHMAHDADGRVWVERIKLRDGVYNSYGVVANLINSGALTNKPIEYHSQLPQNTSEPIGSIKLDEHYADITPLLDRMGPIQEFRRVRGIYRGQSRVKKAI